MRRVFAFVLAFIAAIAFAETHAFARGGHGGGHHGGGHHGGHHGAHHSHHSHPSHSHHGHHSHHNTHHHYAHHGGDHPFSHGWYGHHRGAWGWGYGGYGGYGWGNPWAAATFGAAAGWLGLSALDNAVAPAGETTVYTGDDNAQVVDTNQPNDEQTADSDEQELAASADEAGKLAQSGAAQPATDAKFLPLGVFSIAPTGDDEAKALLHLAVSKEGVLRGTYYDTATDKDHDIQGSIDKKTGRVAFSVAPDSKTVYETTLRELTEQSGPLSVHNADGKLGEWTIAHYDPKEDGKVTQGDDAAAPVEVKTGDNGSPAQPTNGHHAHEHNN
ncbi:MAG: hypothetical protein AB7O59_00555 [Pirellulales bacterium]